MNRYYILDFKTNTILSIEKIKTDFKVNESQTSSISCINSIQLVDEAIDELKAIKKILKEKNK